MILAVAGSRSIASEGIVFSTLDSFRDKRGNITKVITGGAQGVDKLAEEWCELNKIPCKVIRPISPPINNYGLMCLCRDVEILTLSDEVLVLWDGISTGSKFVIDYCKAREKQVYVSEVFKNVNQS